MTPEIHEKYGHLKALVVAFAPFLEMWENDRAEFETKARPFADGTLDAILPHSMSITDMRKSQAHLKKAIRVSQLIGQLRAELASGGDDICKTDS